MSLSDQNQVELANARAQAESLPFEASCDATLWLVMRRAHAGEHCYAWSNADAAPPLERLAWQKCQRVFIKCANREAKNEISWDQLRVQRYPGQGQRQSLPCLATWFVTEARLAWQTRQPRAAALGADLAVPVAESPALSLANVRESLHAVMPLPPLTPERTTALVIEQALNRTAARQARLEAAGYNHSLP